MPHSLAHLASSPPLRRWAFAAVVVLAAAWVLFFDTHSVVRRWAYARDAARLEAENAALAAANDALRRRLEAPLSDEVVERLAREEYGMQRAGETVYRVEPGE